MAGITTYLENKLLDHARGVTSYTMPATVYVALYTVAPTAAGGGTEAAYTGYSRVAAAGLMGAASAGSGANSGAITFPACTGGTSTIVEAALVDASTAGNILLFGSCSLAVSTGITPSFATGQLVVTLS